MDFFNVSFWQGFVGNLLATILGVAAGIPIAFWINRRVESETEKEKREKILYNLLLELEENHQIITRWQESKDVGPSKEMYGALLSDEVWNTFSDGGELQWIKDKSLVGWLAWTYSDIKRTKYLYDSYLHWQSLTGQPEDILNQDLWKTITRAKFNITFSIRIIKGLGIDSRPVLPK
jgi:hypothetical protein